MLAHLISTLGASRTIAYGVSAVLHAGLLACLVAYHPGAWNARIDVAAGGYRIEVQIGDPGGSESGTFLPEPEPDVVVQPQQARIGEHRFIQAPTFDPAAAAIEDPVARPTVASPTADAPLVPPPEMTPSASLSDPEQPRVDVK